VEKSGGHLLISCVEAIPIIGLIASIIELWIAKSRKNPSYPKEMNIKPISLDLKLDFPLPKGVEEAAQTILQTSGFEAVMNEAHEECPVYGPKSLAEGTPILREATARITKVFFHALNLEILRSQKHVNYKQYLTLKIKRLAHRLEIKGQATLPSTKIVNYEGFCEAFTIPMISSSFLTFAKPQIFKTIPLLSG
jgi:hypothetical protein